VQQFGGLEYGYGFRVGTTTRITTTVRSHSQIGAASGDILKVDQENKIFIHIE